MSAPTKAAEAMQNLLVSVEQLCNEARRKLSGLPGGPAPNWDEVADLIDDASVDLEKVQEAINGQLMGRAGKS